MKHSKWQLRLRGKYVLWLAAGEASQTTSVQIMHVFLWFYANCTHTILIPVSVLLLIGAY